MRERQPITCRICDMGDHIKDENGDPCDLNSDIHDGFTIGNGTTKYWYILWHKSGHCTAVRTTPTGPTSRYIKGDTTITIHFY